MSDYEWRQSEPEDVFALAENLSEADRKEAWDAANVRPYQAVMGSYAGSDEPMTGLYKGRPMVMWGVAHRSLIVRAAVPWFLMAEGASRHFRPIAVESKRFVAEAKERYEFMQNFVAADNRRAVRWLKWLGFEIHPHQPFGPNGAKFHRFTMKGTHYGDPTRTQLDRFFGSDEGGELVRRPSEPSRYRTGAELAAAR